MIERNVNMKKIMLVMLMSVICLTGCGKSSTPQSATTTAAETTTTAETTVETSAETTTTAEETTAEETTEDTTETEPSPDIVLIAGKQNEYSKKITTNKDTDAELTRLVYYVPAGKYSVKNAGGYMTQVSVYSTATTVNDDGIEEPADYKVTMIDAGNTEEIEIPEDYYIYISEPTEIELTVIK